QVALFTLDRGAVPAYSVSMYCEGCKVNYYHNYYVKGGHRHYYNDPLYVIEAGKHQFIEQKWSISGSTPW
ncbi:hypothetical protein L208DRAFT_1260424, partial [Tricholoma matsutake]